MRRSCAAVAGVFVAWTTLASAADGPPRPSQVEADGLFREGRLLLEKGQVGAACLKFAESQRLDPALGTLLNLAGCHATAGRTATAWKEYREALSQAEALSDAERIDLARRELAKLEPALSFLALELAPGADVAEILVDEEIVARASWAKPVPLDPGEHKVTCRAPGHPPRDHTILVGDEPGKQKLVIAPFAAAAPPPPPPDERPAQRRRAAGLGALGVGAVGLVLGGVTGAIAVSKKSAQASHCAGRFCDAQGLSLERDARATATISTAAIGVGLIATGAGLFVLLTGPKAAPSKAALRLGPSSVALEGAF